MNIELLKTEITRLGEIINPLAKAQREMQCGLAKAESMEFIRLHGITKDQVQRSNGPDMPYHRNLLDFGRWMKTSATLVAMPKWCEWSGEIMLTQDVIDEKYVSSPSRFEHVPDVAEPVSSMISVPMNDQAVQALRLHLAWQVLPSDRGGMLGQKGRAWDKFIEARDAALAVAKAGGKV